MIPTTYRIAHIDTERTWRGGQRQVAFLIKGLIERGHHNVLIMREQSALAAKIKDFEHIYVSPRGEWDIFCARTLRQKLLDQKIDIVHAHSAHAVALAALATRGTTIPFVLTRRVDFPLNANLFSNWKYGAARKIISISTGVSRVLKESGIPDDKIVLIPSGIDLNVYKTTIPYRKEELGLPRDCTLVGQVAALAPHKDQATFLKTLALLKKEMPHLKALLVGEGELRETLEALAHRLELSDVVTFTGYREDALRIMAAFDVFCLSSKEEGLGTVLLDAMALGVPIVSTNAGGISDLIQDGVTGFLSPVKNENVLAKKILESRQDIKKTKMMCAAALEKAREFDISTTVLKTEEVYRNIMLSTELSPQSTC